MSIDRDGMNKVFFRANVPGAYATAVGTVPPVLAIACATDIAPIAYDPAAAEKELDRLGWKRSATGGFRARDGIPLSFTLLVNSETPRRVQSATMIQQDLAKVGIDVKVEKLPFDALVGRVTERKYEAAIYGFQGSLELKQDDVWGESTMFNVSDYSSRDLQAVLARVRDETDRAKIAELMKEMQRIVYRDQPLTFLCWFSRFAIARDRVQGFAPSVLAFTNDLNLWYLPLALQTSFKGQ
jgi:peptide/nickel transport system substrate-binding protein